MITLRDEFDKCRSIAIIGCLLLLGGICTLFWNEGRATHTTTSLYEAYSSATSVNPNKEQDDNFEGRVLHFYGQLSIPEPIIEPDYNLQQYAVKLRRRVQMYQWVEESVDNNAGENYGESRSYYYTQEWREDLIDSRSFQSPFTHENPRKMPMSSHTHIADSASIGIYELGSDAKNKFNDFLAVASDTRPDDPSIKLHMGFYYHTADVFNPAVGDLRVLFKSAGLDGEYYTVVGMLQEGHIVPYITMRQLPVLLIFPGELSLNEAFALEHYSQRKTTWFYRGMGLILIFFGVTCTSKLLYIILSRIEVLCALAPNPQGPVGANFALSLSLALVIASFAWALHRPMLSVALFCAAISPFVWFARTVAPLI